MSGLVAADEKLDPQSLNSRLPSLPGPDATLVG